MNILFSSNGFWAHTGYATPVAALIPRLQALGHRIGNFAWYGLQGSKMEIGGVTVYPAVPDRTPHCGFGVNVVGNHVADFEADLLVGVHDLWVMPLDYDERVKSKRKAVRWMPWFPVDQTPAPSRVVELAKKADLPCTYSRWGVELMHQAGVATRYLPLGVDTAIFTPGDKAEARTRLGWPQGVYIVSMVAANKATPSRKAFPTAFRAFARLRKARPDLDAHLYCHTNATTDEGGVDLRKLAQSCGVLDRLMIPDGYQEAMGLPEEFLADVYRASDVLLCPSRTEGFGIPLIEAQACGCPVITNCFASMPELTVYGVSVEPAQLEWTPLDAWESIPSEDRAADALIDWAGRTEAANADLREEKCQLIRQLYDWDVLVERYWKPLLAEVEQCLP